MSALFEVTNSGPKTYSHTCYACGQLVASSPWTKQRGTRTWDTFPDGKPNLESEHDCKPTQDEIS